MALKSSSTPSVRLTASLLPENFIQGGLPSDFDAVIRRARFGPWNYMGKRENYSLAVFVDYEPDEDSGIKPFTQPYSAGDLHRLVPTLDGKTPAGATIEEYKILAEGPDEPLSEEEIENLLGYEALPIKPDTKDQTKNEKQITNSTNLAFFMAKAIDAKFPLDRIDNDIRFLEGAKVHLVRIDGPDRGNLKKGAGSENSQSDGKILVITDFYGFEGEKGGKGGGKSSATTTTKKTTTPSSSTPASKRSSTPAVEDLEEEEVEEQNEETSEEAGEGGGDDFDSEVESAILNILAKNKGKVKRTALSPLVMREFTDGESKALALTRLDDVIANGDGWTYDEETKILSLA